MSIIAVCPHCGTKLRVPDTAAGRTFACPKCRDTVTVSNGTNARPKAAGSSSPPQLPLDAKLQPTKEASAPLAHTDSELPLVVTDYITTHLMPGEHLIAVSRVHPMVMLAPGIVAAFGLLLSLIGIAVGKERGIAIAFVGFSTAIIAGIGVLVLLIERLTTEFSCTDRRILIKSGLLTTSLREMPLGKVEALLMQQGLFGKIFGYGTLVFKGSGGTRRTCKSMELPFDFYKRVQEQVAAAQKH